jgi:predicted RND superfamily exporter protein
MQTIMIIVANNYNVHLISYFIKRRETATNNRQAIDTRSICQKMNKYTECTSALI